MPTNVLMYLTLESKYQTDAASSAGLIRNLVGGFAISGVFAVFTRDNQFFHAHLVEAITPTTFMAGWPALLPLDSVQGAWVLNMEITRQAAMQSYLNIFTAMQWMSIVIAALLIVTRPKRSKIQALAA
jgi:DHA2 family multidrug resistance protein